MAKAKHDNELRLIRVFEAPVKLVWEMWVDDKHVKNWYGPRGFTHTTKSKEIRPGGSWVFTMHGPDGVDYPNITTYLEVEKYKRLVYDHGATEDRPPLFRVTVTFEEVLGKTVMDMTMSLATKEAALEAKKFIKMAQGDSTWDRLAEYIEKVATDKELFIVNRSFDAPQKLVFAMWTNAEHVKKWMGLTGSTIKILKMQPHDLLEYTQNFCDDLGRVSKPPFFVTVLFTNEGDNDTRVTVRCEVDDSATDAEIEAFRKAKDGMTLEWWGSFNKLEELLSL